MKHLIAFFTLTFLCYISYAQERIIEYRQQEVSRTARGVTYSFTVDDNTLPALQPIDSTRARFEYFWEFGDGNYGRGKNVRHTYTTPGTKEVIMKISAVYDDGDPPRSVSTNGNPTVKGAAAITGPITREESIILGRKSIDLEFNHTTKDAIPNEENIVVLKYKNTEESCKSGRLFLFYNEKEVGDAQNYVEQFQLIGAPRIYNEAKDIVRENYLAGGSTDNVGLDSISALLPTFKDRVPQLTRSNIQNNVAQTLADYENFMVFEFKYILPSWQSHIFLTLKTASDIGDIEDEEVIIKGILIRDTGNTGHDDLALRVVNAHDPNGITVSETRESFREVQDKELTYKVKFHNDGEAPAKHVHVKIDVPESLSIDEVKNLSNSFNIKPCANNSTSEPCFTMQISEDKKHIDFSFRNVYLRGLGEEGVEDYDETIGSFEYKVAYKEQFKKRPLDSRAHIIFEDRYKKQEPVRTNFATTRFKPGLSIGPKAGVQYNLTDKELGFYIGAVASPYKSEKFYYQPEIMLSYDWFNCEYDTESGPSDGSKCQLINNGEYITVDTVVDSAFFYLERTTIDSSLWNVKSRSFALNLVPLQIRRDFNDFIGVGLGLETGLVYQKNTFFEKKYEKIEISESVVDIVWIVQSELTNNTERPQSGTTKFHSSLFADIAIGKVKEGPSISIRYLRELLPTIPKTIKPASQKLSDKNKLQVSLLWKF